MWEQIRANKRKSIALVAIMAVLLLGLGFVVGEVLAPGAGLIGLAAALALWITLSLVSYFQGDNILLAVSRAKPVEKQDAPQLFNVVEEMKIASGLGKMPKIYLVNDTSMNAFAVGRSPDNAAIAVTSGLLANLDRDELQGVIAHETAHIVNRDVLFMTMVGIMLGAIVMIGDIFLRGMWYTGGGRSRRYSSSSRGGGQAQAIFAILAIVFAILAPVLAQLIYFAVSRRREYLADAHAVTLTRYPEGLASALERLGAGKAPLTSATKATAPMYIINPFAKASLKNMSSTHPPLGQRIAILRSIGGTVSYGAYQQAWANAAGEKAGKLPASALDAGKTEPVRKAHPDAAKRKSPRQRLREAGDLVRKANNFLFLPCVCGLRIKLPPNFKKDKVDCPRCHRELAVPMAQLAALGQIADTVADQMPKGTPVQGPLTIRRKGKGWMSFNCTCGATMQLSPNFNGNQMHCRSCGRTIHIES